jgi:signal transduction histidine kinase
VPAGQRWPRRWRQAPFAAEVEVAVGAGVLQVDVRDDGRGGADLGRGSGLLGLKDRVEALGGWISLQSAAGGGHRHADRPAPRRPQRTGAADRRPTG